MIPALNATSPKHASPQSQVFLASFDTALDLFKINNNEGSLDHVSICLAGKNLTQDIDTQLALR